MLELVHATPRPVCWRSEGNQHACTKGDPIGVLRGGTLSGPAGTCPVVGWVEPLDDAWQLDLEIARESDCAHGTFRAVIEP